MEKRIVKDYAYRTFQRYQTSIEKTRSFIPWKFEKSDLEIKDLDLDLTSEYVFWLKSLSNCGCNATMKYKKIVLGLIKRGWFRKIIFRDLSLLDWKRSEFSTKAELELNKWYTSGQLSNFFLLSVIFKKISYINTEVDDI